MGVQVFYPSNSLANIVHHYEIIEVQQVRNFKKYFYPNFCLGLTFIYYSDSKLKAINKKLGDVDLFLDHFIAPTTLRWSNEYSGNVFKLMRVIFQIGMMYELFHIPINETTNHGVQASDFLGKELKELQEKITEASSIKMRIHHVEEFLLKKAKFKNITGKLIVALKDSIRRNTANIKVKELAKEIGLSDRQLQRQILSHTGYSPKKFLQVWRFCQAKTQIQENITSIRLTDLAYQLGYHDQAHFNRDFKLFSGQTPKQYLRSISPWIEPEHDYLYTGLFEGRQ